MISTFPVCAATDRTELLGNSFLIIFGEAPLLSAQRTHSMSCICTDRNEIDGKSVVKSAEFGKN